MELPSIQDILADVSAAGQEYLDTEAEIRDSVRELESLELPEITSGPPKPPTFVSKDTVRKGKETKKVKKKKNNQVLTSFRILPSDPKTKPVLVYKQVDTSAVERVLANTSLSARKAYKIINASDSSSDDDKSLARATLGEMDSRNVGWRQDSLKMLRYIIRFYNSRNRSAKSKEIKREKVLHKPKKNILAYMDKMLIKEDNSGDVDLEKKSTVAQFDSVALESFFPEDRLKEAKKNGLPGLKAYSRYYTYAGSVTEWCWKPCLVLEYDSSSKKFLLEWEGSSTRKYATRLNILFEGESKELFFQRIENAVVSRECFEEGQTYYQNIINCKMPPFLPLCRKTKIAIISRIGLPISVDQVPIVVMIFA
jgi:hypothetical protein